MRNAIIAHECWHLLEKVLPGSGVSIDWSGEYNEHIAYYLSFLYENYYKLIQANIFNQNL